MNYLALSQELFEGLKTFDVPNANSGGDEFTELSALFGGSLCQMRDTWMDELNQRFDATLAAIGATREKLQLQEISSYERSVQVYTLTVLFWAWRNGLALTESELSNLAQAAFEATLGYRLIDVHVDHGKLGAEAITLGTYLIRSHEHRLAKIFGADLALPILRRYADLCASVEYLEKTNRWRPCPFSWQDAKRIGLKAAPAFTIFHLMFARKGKPDIEIERLVDGLCYAFAAIQMSDDLADMPEDLGNGTETLAASGFYEWNGGREVNGARVREYFDQRRLRRFVHITLGLMNAAIVLFEKGQDEVLLLLAEHRKHQFLRRWSVRLGSARSPA